MARSTQHYLIGEPTTGCTSCPAAALEASAHRVTEQPHEIVRVSA